MTTTHEKDTTYIRAVNDYTSSAHELYSKTFGAIPTNVSVITIDKCSFTLIPKLVESISNFANGEWQNFIPCDTYISTLEHDEEEPNSYTIYNQTVALFAVDDAKCDSQPVAIECIGSNEHIYVTILSRATAISAILAKFVKSLQQEFKSSVPKKDRTFYTISSGSFGFELEDLTIKNNLNGDLLHNYNDDFVEVDDLIMTNITENRAGLVLLHGVPGSGKTSYIKHLITSDVERKIIYLPTHLTTSISSPNFISFVKKELANSVLIIEDAEQVLLSRDTMESNKEAVSNLLNMTDGILADALNLLIICTFNTDTANIDKALLRKGRLLINYKFGKLSIDKTNALTDMLYGKTVDESMTLADIYGLEYDLISHDTSDVKKLKVGFY